MKFVMCHAGMGHIHLIHSYTLKKDFPPQCETVRHILVDCNTFVQERKCIFGKRDVVVSFKFHPH